jgi:hypothetical protein
VVFPESYALADDEKKLMFLNKSKSGLVLTNGTVEFNMAPTINVSRCCCESPLVKVSARPAFSPAERAPLDRFRSASGGGRSNGVLKPILLATNVSGRGPLRFSLIARLDAPHRPSFPADPPL